jgi:hypothetical protein
MPIGAALVEVGVAQVTRATPMVCSGRGMAVVHTWQHFVCAQIFCRCARTIVAAWIRKRREVNVFKSAFWAGWFVFKIV